MAPTGLQDDPVVIDDDHDRASFLKMKQKLTMLQREIQDVLQQEEDRFKRSSSQEPNRLKRARSDSGSTSSEPPPLIRIASHDLEQEDALDFLQNVQMTMAGTESNSKKRMRRANMLAPAWETTSTEWGLLECEDVTGVEDVEDVREEELSESDDEIEIIGEFAGSQKKDDLPETEPQQNPKKESFTRVEIIWPDNDTKMETEDDPQEASQKNAHTMDASRRDLNLDINDHSFGFDDGNEVEIVNEVDVRAMVRALEEKKRMCAMFHEKANRIIDRTRARANFTVSLMDTSGSAENPLIIEEDNNDVINEENMEVNVDDDEQKEGKEYKDVNCGPSNDAKEYEDLDEVEMDVLEIPNELLAEVENLNQMKPKLKQNEDMKPGSIWRKMAAIFIVTKFVEFLDKRNLQIGTNMVAAC